MHSQLIEVNAHSLFSKWFSESGKLVAALFARIREALDEESTLVFVLVDEVRVLDTLKVVKCFAYLVVKTYAHAKDSIHWKGNSWTCLDVCQQIFIFCP